MRRPVGRRAPARAQDIQTGEGFIVNELLSEIRSEAALITDIFAMLGLVLSFTIKCLVSEF